MTELELFFLAVFLEGRFFFLAFVGGLFVLVNGLFILFLELVALRSLDLLVGGRLRTFIEDLFRFDLGSPRCRRRRRNRSRRIERLAVVDFLFFLFLGRRFGD